MTLIKPFRGLRPKADLVSEVIAPPYDVINSQEASILAKNKPWSFLHISKPEIDLPSNTDPYSDDVYNKATENFSQMLNKNILQKDATPCYYAYRITMGNHQQTGLVTIASVAAYDQNQIRKHEYTRPKKEDDRVRQIDSIGAQTGPVLLTYKHNNEIDKIIDAVTQHNADVDVTDDNQIRHQLWKIDNPEIVDQITTEFEKVNTLYIADGHHRSAAASRVAKMPARKNSDLAQYFLSVIFPDNQLNILSYNRVIKDLNGLTTEDLLQKIGNDFSVEASEKPYQPQLNDEFGMYLNGQWYRLKIKAELIPINDLVKSLGASLLSDYLIEPILGVTDFRKDPRIDFVGGIRGLKELEKRVDSGEMAVAFSLCPTAVNDLLAVADNNKVMPPKSTWFEPKLADGLVSYMIEETGE